MSFLASRLPDRQEIALALGGVVFVVFGWAVRGFIYQLPSFLLFHSVGDILAIFAYMMALALLESLTVLGAMVIASVFLPSSWFRDGFAHKALLAVLVTGGAAVGLEHYLTKGMTSVALLYGGLLLAILFWTALAGIIDHRDRLRSILRDLMDRLQIFTYLFVPIGILSLLIVVSRNLR